MGPLSELQGTGQEGHGALGPDNVVINCEISFLWLSFLFLNQGRMGATAWQWQWHSPGGLYFNLWWEKEKEWNFSRRIKRITSLQKQANGKEPRSQRTGPMLSGLTAILGESCFFWGMVLVMGQEEQQGNLRVLAHLVMLSGFVMYKDLKLACGHFSLTRKASSAMWYLSL